MKELAKQTAEATERIEPMILAIRTDTAEAVSAIDENQAVIGEIHNISGTIAAAVEEQSATTAEFTRNVASAGEGTSSIAGNIGTVAEAVAKTSAGAGQVQQSAGLLSGMATTLEDLVAQFELTK